MQMTEGMFSFSDFTKADYLKNILDFLKLSATVWHLNSIFLKFAYHLDPLNPLPGLAPAVLAEFFGF